MCEHGDTVSLLLPTPDPDGRRWDMRMWEIDRCIAPIVSALNASGVVTRGSCCGHGKGAGQIVLADGRWLVVTTREAALAADLPPHLAPGKPHQGDHDEDTDADADRQPSPVRAPQTSRGAEGEAGELDGHLRGPYHRA